jgi:hypothetical protein
MATGDATVGTLDGEFAPVGGAAAGLLAAAAMAVAIVAVDLSTLRVAIAGLYGFEGNIVAGLVAHLAHGAAFGLLFGALLAEPTMAGATDSRGRTLVAALAYALVLAVAAAGVVMPIWLRIAGVSGPAPPHVTVATVAWHAVYGVVLGAVYPAVAARR